jgi:hypothetical protein
MGNMIATILSSVVRALNVSQTAMHTNALHKMPRATACKNV